MCNIFGEYFQNFTTLTSGIVFIFLGFFGLFGGNANRYKKLTYSFIQSVILGLSVGLDGSLGCFTLTTLGYNAFWATFTIGLVHMIFIMTSLFIGNICNKNFKFSKVLSPLVLIALGIYKIVNFI